jgi:hypothetical protein
MTMQTVMILLGSVAVIGVIAILVRRGVLGGAKAQDSTASTAKQ